MAETITMEINDPIVRMEEEVHDIEEVPTKLVEEEVFDKKVKKRQLTDKQKQALQAGRAKAKAQREAKRMEEVKKQVAKEEKSKVREERKQLAKAEAEATEQLKTKRQKKTAQEKARERIKARKAEKDKADNKRVDEFNELKYTYLESCDTEEDFDKLDNILNRYITRSDILKGNDHIRNKIGEVVSLLKK